MTTEFGEIIIEDENTQYKYINPTLKVYTDGGVAIYNVNENEWDDAKIDYQGYIKYWDTALKKCVVEMNAHLVARAFIPNPQNHKRIFYKDKNKKNCAVSNLAWGEKPKTLVGYRKENERFSVRIWDKKAKKVTYYGSYDTEEEAEARVAEIRVINIKN